MLIIFQLWALIDVLYNYNDSSTLPSFYKHNPILNND